MFRKQTWAVLPFIFACIVLLGGMTADGSQLKVLAIGNSFSQDGVRLLPHLARDAGIETVVVGNMYVAGASINTHWLNAQMDEPAYVYEKNVSGTWQSRAETTLRMALQDEDWDVITLQQASGLSGVASSYVEHNRLAWLVDYINEHTTNPQAKLAWHMTWAYQADSTHASFAHYNNDQFTMFTAITNAVQEHIVPNEAFHMVIPAGTAMQNVRTSYIGDTLTRDGYHLSTTLGRYIAGLTWLKALGWPIDDITYVPSETDVPRAYWPVLHEAVHKAVEAPYEVSDLSSMREAIETLAIASRANVPNGYTLFNWEPVGCAAWQEVNAKGPYLERHANTSEAACFVVSSGQLFTRDDIPPGSIIEIERGFQYVTLG